MKQKSLPVTPASRRHLSAPATEAAWKKRRPAGAGARDWSVIMGVGMTLLLWLCAMGAAAASGRIDRYPGFPSKYVSPRDVTVWLPDGYDPQGPRLPVVYMQDGENLYEPSHSLSHADWQVDRTLARLIQDRKIPPVIVVGIASTPLRGREYLPRKIFDRLPGALRATIAESWGGAPLSDDYLRFMVDELKPFIDARYRVRKDARRTFVMGSSMGGLISLYAQAEYPRVFGGSASLSMHWLMGEPWKTMIHVDQRWLQARVTSAFIVYLQASSLKPAGHRLYVDRGDLGLDAFYAPFTAPFATRMATLGWTDPRHFQSRVFAGEGHDEAAWARRLETPVMFLLGAQVAPEPPKTPGVSQAGGDDLAR